MKRFLLVVTVFTLFSLVSCGNVVHQADTANTGDTGNTVDTADTGNTGNTGNTADTTDTGNTADTADTADTGNSGNTSDTADTGNTTDTGNTSDTGDSGDTADTGDTNSPYPSPYGSITLDGTFNYIMADGESSTEDSVVMEPFATGTMHFKDLLPATDNQQSRVTYYTDGYFNASQVIFNRDGDGNAMPLNPYIILSVKEQYFVPANSVPVGLAEKDQAALYVFDVDWGTNKIACLHALAIGTIDITDANGSVGSRGSFKFNGTLDLYTPKNVTPYGGDITSKIQWPACDPY